ncbi:MAG: PEP-CTERM sorting domain-containing protein [Candidatus Sumerlaeia bacterium]
MKKRMTALTLGAACCATLSLQALTIVDTFDGLTLGDINGQNGWVQNTLTGSPVADTFTVITDPGNASNQVLEMSDASNQSINQSLGGLGVTDSNTGTLYFEFQRADSAANFFWSGYARDEVNNFDDGRAYTSYSNPDLRARDGGSDTDIDGGNPISVGEWFGVWLVASDPDNTALYDVYIQGGAWASQTTVAEDFDMRGGTGDDLTHVSFFGNASSAGTIYFDNVYAASGEDLSLPSTTNIPEPSSFALLAGALGLGLVVLRRRPALSK